MTHSTRLRLLKPYSVFKLYRRLSVNSRISHAPVARVLTISTQSHRSYSHEGSTLSSTKDFESCTENSLSRLNSVYTIILDKATSLSKKCSLIFDLYQKHIGDLTEDLGNIGESGTKQISKLYEQPYLNDDATSEHLKSEIRDWVRCAPGQSSCALSMVLDLILNNIMKGNFLSSCDMLHLISDSRQISRSQQANIGELLKLLKAEPQLNEDQNKQILDSLAEYCITYAIACGNPIVATLLLFRCKSQLTISQRTIKRVILALSASHPLISNYNYYAILKIINQMDKVNFEPAFYLHLLSNVSQGANDPYFPNILFIHALNQSGIFAEDFTGDVNCLRHLIQLNLDHGSNSRALLIWKLCYSHDTAFASKNLTLFKNLFTSCDKHTKLTLLKEYFPTELRSHPDIFDTILAFYGRNAETLSEFSTLVKTINPPVSRALLSSLLKSFIFQHKTDEVNQLTKAINNSQGSFLSSEIDVIIKQLLQNSDLSEAVRVAVYYNVLASKQGLVRIVEYLLSKDLEGNVPKIEPEDPLLRILKDSIPTQEHNLPSKDANCPMLTENPVLRFAGQELSKLGNDRVLCDLTVSITKYLSQKYGTGVGRRLFMNKDKQRGLGFAFDFVKFGLPKVFTSTLRIDKRNRVACIEAIFSQARQEKDRVSIDWCISELRKSGILVNDIIDTHFNEIA